MVILFVLIFCVLNFSAHTTVDPQQISNSEFNISEKVDNDQIDEINHLKKEIPKSTEIDLQKDFFKEVETIFIFSGWFPDPNVRESKRTIHKDLAKMFFKDEDSQKVFDFTDKYVDVKDHPMPKFDSSSVVEQILERLNNGEKIFLISYSEGTIALFQTLEELVNNCKEIGIEERFQENIKVYFIDPPSKDLFTLNTSSLYFWFVGWVGDWVNWIAGISMKSKFSQRNFPFLSDIFLNSFRWFWKNFLIPIFYWQFGHDDKFYRAAFAKSRSYEFENKISSLDQSDADLMKKISTVYLQNWRNEKAFSKIASVMKMKEGHRSIKYKVLGNIEKDLTNRPIEVAEVL